MEIDSENLNKYGIACLEETKNKLTCSCYFCKFCEDYNAEMNNKIHYYIHTCTCELTKTNYKAVGVDYIKPNDCPLKR